MNTTKSITLAISAIIAIVIMLLIIQLLTRKLKAKSQYEGRLKYSYGIWFSALFISAAFITERMIFSLAEAIDNIQKYISANILGEVAKTASLFIGLSGIWFIIWYYIANMLSVTVVGIRKSQNEIDIDNITYFIIKGVLIFGFIYCLSPVFEIILRTFMPTIQIPFYH